MGRNNNLLTEGRLIDFFIVYAMAKKFITPFTRWKAYDLGIIDEKGKRTKKPIKSIEDKKAYTLLDRMIRKIRVFVGDRFFLKMTLAWLLLREEHDIDKTLLTEDEEMMSPISGEVFETSMKIGLTEGILIQYVDDIETFRFFIYTTLNGEPTSAFGAFNIPKHDNEQFLTNINSIVDKIKTGGLDEFNVYDDEGNVVKVSANYGGSEFTMEGLGRLYAVFSNDSQIEEFQHIWKEIFNSIKES